MFLARPVDAVIERYDPKAVRRAQEVIRRPSFDDNVLGRAGRLERRPIARPALR